MTIKQILDNLSQKLSLDRESKVLIVGLGETGISVAKFLKQQGIKFAVVDSRDKPPCQDILTEDYPDTPVFTGGFDEIAFRVSTHIVVSPGVPLHELSINRALNSGVKLVSDIDLFACATEKPIVAITGSNGKSTVTTMLGAMGKASGVKTAIGGNLGIPALELLNEAIDLYVIELSSFQLERTSVLNAAAATVLNISADHMDRHDNIDLYAKEKNRVFSGNGVMLLNEDDPIVKEMNKPGRQTMYFSVHKEEGFHLATIENKKWLMSETKPLMQQSELPVEGIHNVANALAALALGANAGFDEEAMCLALKSYHGLDHRMQKVAQIKGVTWVNDSKATNIGACIAALEGYQKKVVLIAGGDAKGADMNLLASAIKAKAKCVVLMGKDANVIETALNSSVPSHQVTSIEEAVKFAAMIAEDGDSVLLSPACASIDQYKNYQERGDKFTAAVMELAA